MIRFITVRQTYSVSESRKEHHMTTPPSDHRKPQQTVTLTALLTDTAAQDIQPGNLIALCGAKGADNMTPTRSCDPMTTLSTWSLHSLRGRIQK